MTFPFFFALEDEGFGFWEEKWVMQQELMARPTTSLVLKQPSLLQQRETSSISMEKKEETSAMESWTIGKCLQRGRV